MVVARAAGRIITPVTTYKNVSTCFPSGISVKSQGARLLLLNGRTACCEQAIILDIRSALVASRDVHVLVEWFSACLAVSQAKPLG